MEEELLACQVKTGAIQLALQAIMSKLEVNTKKMREEPEVNFTFAEESKASSFSMGQVRVKPASPWNLMETKKKGGHSSTLAAFTSVSVETCSNETKHAYTGPCPIKWLTPLIRSCAWNKGLESGITRTGRPSRESSRNCFAQVTVVTKLKGMSWYQGRDLVKDYIYQLLS